MKINTTDMIAIMDDCKEHPEKYSTILPLSELIGEDCNGWASVRAMMINISIFIPDSDGNDYLGQLISLDRDGNIYIKFGDRRPGDKELLDPLPFCTY